MKIKKPEIPVGYHKPTKGVVKETDLILDLIHMKWERVEREDIGQPVEYYKDIIRKDIFV